MAVRTLDLLPAVFRTSKNQKFLNATLEQATSETDLARVNGFVGRKFTPTFRSTDNYLPEPTTDRENYQFEPSTVVKNDQGEVIFVNTYIDLLQGIGFHGGLTNNHDRLFSAEAYTFTGEIDLDKFVNFSQYYWLPSGPDSVDIRTTSVATSETYRITRSPHLSEYSFADSGDVATSIGIGGTPTIYLARGGSYTFNVSQTGIPFWIQSEIGTTGVRVAQSNISSREVLGVGNNGDDFGSITFNVPLKDSQNFYLNMTTLQEVDLATDLDFNKVHNQLLSTVLATYGGIDGQRSLDAKTVIFSSQDGWLFGGVFDKDGENYDANLYDAGYEPTDAQKWGIWRVKYMGNVSDPIVTLVPLREILTNNKVLVREGLEYGNKEFYKANSGYLEEVPIITAILDTLYYQDGVDGERYGTIKLVEPTAIANINVDADILGKTVYTSASGVVFTNGLKVRFDSGVIPVAYQNKLYYVEGVGSGITLTDVGTLVTPETYTVDESVGFDLELYDSTGYEATANAPTSQDYIVSQRDSLDGNAWARGNRWFHIDAINATATYNNFTPTIDQTKRGKRPIIEFNPNLEMYNFGKVAKAPVDIIDTSTLDAFTLVEGSASYVSDGIDLAGGQRIVFAADSDDDVRNKVYEVLIIDPQNDGSLQIHLTPTVDTAVQAYETVVVKLGTQNQGKQFWFNGTNWISGQQKTSTNVEPLFNIYDSAGNSFSDTTAYPGTDFKGTKIFSYRRGTGTLDQYLGFPLSYRNFQSVGDILYDNNFASDNFRTTASSTNAVNNGFLHSNSSLTAFTSKNTWEKTLSDTRQFQVYSYEYKASNKFLYPATEITSVQRQTLKVYVGSVLLGESQYSKVTISNQQYIEISTTVDLTDKTVTILTLDNSVLANAYYQIPTNLDYNSVNANFNNVTLGQLRNHFQTSFENTLNVSGVFPGRNNSRDINAKQSQGSILQHTSGLPYAMLFTGDKQTNFFDSLDLAAREYSNFKNKFIEASFTLSGLEQLSTDKAVDAIITSINEAKTDTFPWYYSDMIPAGSTYTEFTETWRAGNSKSIRTTYTNKMDTPSQVSVLVFNGTTQLLRYKDYNISSDGLFVEFTADYTPAHNDVITIREYTSTNGSFVPETPTKMGMYPSYQPRLLTDSTYRTTTTFVIGHDGSYTPSFGDSRDDLLLELEKRIYNNIKVRYQKSRLDLHDVFPGQFRTTEYSRAECVGILGQEFSRWAGNNVIDFANQDFFNNSDPFTYNWSQSSSAVDGVLLPGFWRGVYRHYYDTDTPHLTPWECLGLAEEPSWWAAAYGTAPFSSGNLVLWDDLETGYIKEPGNTRIDTRYARPGVTKFIPVNVYGELKAPNEFLIRSFNGTYIQKTFVAGDEAPAETAWIKSSQYPFAVQKLLALVKPAKYFGLNARVSGFTVNSNLGQYVLSSTNNRLTKSDITINGALVGSVRQFTAGYVNWISDRIRSLGVDPAVTLRNKLDNLYIQLASKLGGFTDKTYLKVLAEQNSPTSTTDSVFIPDTDYELFLQKSSAIERLSYSAVIVEKTAKGYKVDGYDTDNPYFRIVPHRKESKSGGTLNIFGASVALNDEFLPVSESVPYGTEFTSQQAVIDFLLGYGRYLTAQGFVFQARIGTLGETKTWLMSAKEFLVWAQQGWASGNLLVLSPVFDQLELVLDNATIDNISGAYRSSRILDQNYNTIGSKELEIDRIGNSASIKTANNKTIGLAVLETIQYEHTFVPNNITVFNDVIYQPELGNRQGRVKLVGFKSNNWNGTISPGGFLLNQDNIALWQTNTDYRKGKLVKFKQRYYRALANTPASTTFKEENWVKIDYNAIKKGLLPNLSNTAAAIEKFYDIDDINLESDADLFSKSLIGYKNREYLNALGIDDTSQVKFYQGFIQEKGTLNSINALVKARLNNLNTSVNLFEEWAFRTGSYGVLDKNQVIEIQTSDATYSNSNTTVKLLTASDATPIDIVSVPFAGVYKRPANYNATPFVYRDFDTDLNKDIAKAGFPRLDDTDWKIFDIRSATTLDQSVEKFGLGQEIWVAKDYNGSWNTYRITETNTLVTKLTNITNNFMKVTCSLPHTLSKDDVVIIKDVDTRFNAIYRVYSVINGLEFSVKSTQARMSLLIDPNTGAPGSVGKTGNVYKLVSNRYAYPSRVAATDPLNHWKVGDKVFVDEYNSAGDWQVLEKTEPWSNNKKYIRAGFDADDLLGQTVLIGQSATWVAVGAPGRDTGRVQLYDINSINDLEQDTLLDAEVGAGADITQLFGRSLATGQLSFNYDGSTVVSDEYLAVGAPDSNSTRGGVVIYRYRSGTWTAHQYIAPVSAVVSDEFGKAVAISQDASWLYIGAPGEDKVYAYCLDTKLTEQSVTVTGDGSTTVHALGFTPKSLTSIFVQDATGVIYRPTTDYTVSGSDITFATAPSVNVTVSENFSYKYIATLTASGGDAGDQFGASVWTSTDGTQTVIGAPSHDNAGEDSVINSGASYVFDRTVEAFKGDGSTTAFTTIRSMDADVNKTTVNRVLQDQRKGADAYWDYSVSGTTLTFNIAPSSGAIIKVDTNTFIQMQKMAEQTANTRGVGNSFGKTVLICPTDCSIYIGNPSDDPRELRNSGSVDRYVNQGRVYGLITSTKTSPTVTATDSIRINDFEVAFTGTTIDSVKTDINNAGIAGVSASVTSGVLTVTSTSTIELQKLKVLPGVGTGLIDLGLTVFYYTQSILAPKGSSNSNFGDTIAISDDATKLFVGAPNCTMRVNVQFDVDAVDNKPDTTFDIDSTTFFDTNPNSGAAYVYEFLGNPRNLVTDPGQFDFVQELEVSSATDNMAAEDRFGVSISVRGNYAVVGAEQDDEQGIDAGAVYDFDSTGVGGWKVLRSRTSQIEPRVINKAYLYNRVTKEISTYLDVYDPAKGKFIGLASQETDYISEVDPATYSTGWSGFNKGKYWWDTSTVRYIDYEQGDYLYRSNNWGSSFPGSVFNVYEWVETDVLPSNYVSAGYNGVPRDENNIDYVTKTKNDTSTGASTPIYCYWVGQRTVTDNITKSLTISQVNALLTDPFNQGVAHIAIMDKNLIGMFNIQSYIDSDNVILGINYDTSYNEAVLHNEYQLVQENKADAALPNNIVEKLYDSLCGEDVYGNAVPQTGLVKTERYGINIRPRQTVFVDRGNALEALFRYVNIVMTENQVSESRDLTRLLSKEPTPTKAVGGWTESLNSYAELLFLDQDLFSDGYKVLVLADEQNNAGGWSLYELDVVDSSTRIWLQIDKQSYDTTTYWDYADWYASDHDLTTIPDHNVTDRNAVAGLTNLSVGDIINVTNRGNGLFEVLRVKDDLTTEVVGLEDGTIQFKSTIWSEVQSGYWDDYNIFATGAQSGIQQVGANINNVWGIGSGDAGYGQTNIIVPKAEDSDPSTEEWSAMFTINNSIGSHQDTAMLAMSSDDLELDLDDISTNITNIHTNRLVAKTTNVGRLTNIDSTGSWSDSATQVIRSVFNDPDKTRYFFNAGGYIAIAPTVTGYTDDAKARSWVALTQMSGTIKLNAQTTTVTGDSTSATVTETHTSSTSVVGSNIGYYDLTSVDQLIFEKTLTTAGSPYISATANNVKIYAKTNGTIGNNTDNGTIITFTVVLSDASDDSTGAPTDTMDGTVRSAVTYYEPSATYISKTWSVPATSLYSKTHE